ncbi:hypothetical protein [Leifsonia sp. RAF41]|uniref:hypothetical protein n=1 Tax=Leifsonia sp. RAF41 TaxID=3233056 RepID=UPI003F95485D
MSAVISGTRKYLATRFSTPVSLGFDEARELYESLVPALDVEKLTEVARRSSSWQAIAEWTRAQAPLGFLRYWRNDATLLMRVAGNTSFCTAYLMGNHVIAERMFRHDPRVMNYAPLRVELTQAGDGPVLFTAELPHLQFGSFERPEITDVGRDLSSELAALIRALGAPVPMDLQDWPPGHHQTFDESDNP